MSGRQDDVAEAAKQLIYGMDGAGETTWAELADNVAADPHPVEVPPTELALLIRALIAAGELRGG